MPHAQTARLVIRGMTSSRRLLRMKRRFVAAISAFVSLQKPLPHAPPTTSNVCEAHRRTVGYNGDCDAVFSHGRRVGNPAEQRPTCCLPARLDEHQRWTSVAR
jgi:hypothetical protein